MDFFSSNSFDYTPLDFGDFSVDQSDIDAFNLGGHVDFTAFDVPGHETLDHSMFDVNDTNELAGMADFTPAMNWLASPDSHPHNPQYDPDPDLNPDFEFNLRDGLLAEMHALDTVVSDAPQSVFTFTEISSPPEHGSPVVEKKKPVKKPITKKPRAQKPSSDPPSRITKPRTRKPRTPKAKIALPSPTTYPFTLYQEHRLQAAVLQFLGSPSLQQQFLAEYGHTSPERLKKFINDPSDQQRLLQGMVNRELTNPKFQSMLLQSSYGRQA